MDIRQRCLAAGTWGCSLLSGLVRAEIVTGSSTPSSATWGKMARPEFLNTTEPSIVARSATELISSPGRKSGRVLGAAVPWSRAILSSYGISPGRAEHSIQLLRRPQGTGLPNLRLKPPAGVVCRSDGPASPNGRRLVGDPGLIWSFSGPHKWADSCDGPAELQAVSTATNLRGVTGRFGRWHTGNAPRPAPSPSSD